MSIEICIHETHTDPEAFKVNPQAVYQLFKHGWEPPAGASYVGHTPDGSNLLIPARTRQATAPPTHAQITAAIRARFAARGTISDLAEKAIAEAAEAIQDLFGVSE